MSDHPLPSIGLIMAAPRKITPYPSHRFSPHAENRCNDNSTLYLPRLQPTFRVRQTCWKLCCAVTVGRVDLNLGEIERPTQIRSAQVRSVQLRSSKVRFDKGRSL